MDKEFNSKMLELFENDYFADEFEPDGPLADLAENVVEEYGWNSVYSWFYDYLTTRCDTDIAVYNAINLYYCYAYEENPVSNPYDLIGYVYYRINLETHWEDWGDFLDGFAIGLLESCGKVDIVADPYYRSWEDKKVVAAVEKWRAQNES